MWSSSAVAYRAAVAVIGLGYVLAAPTNGVSDPPFSSEISAAIDALAALPSLINPSSLLAGIDPAVLAAFFGSAINTKDSQPNPIASQFPNLVTGTVNATYVVLPIDYATARSIIPSKYAILNNSLKAVLPDFPQGKYPVLLSFQLDHDVRNFGLTIPDFLQAQFRFPFVDLLGDGYSAFSYIPSVFMSANLVSIAGAAAYGESTIISTFDPPKDPYNFVPGRNDQIYSKVQRIGSSEIDLAGQFNIQDGRCGGIGEYPLSFYQNVTNQVQFSCGTSKCLLTCDNMIRFFKTNLTIDNNAPVGVTGSVTLAPSVQSSLGLFPNGGQWDNVYGAKYDQAFIENNYKSCSDFKGYQYQGV